MRNKYTLTREQRKPACALTVKAKDSSAVCYIYANERGMPCVMGFAGKSDKPAIWFRYTNETARNTKVSEFLANVKATEDSKAKRAAEKKAFVHTLKVGDVLSNSWGYDQTNVEFFQVTALIGRCMVKVREIAQHSEETGFMTGNCAPALGEFIGPVRKHRVLEGNTLDIHHAGFGRASPYHMTEVVPGVKVGMPQRWSSYA